MKITKTEDGRAYLHVWREGEEYFRQKGQILLQEWTNVMFSVISQADADRLYYVDISKGVLDFADHSFDAVYAYHVLEHLTASEGEQFSLEVMRVLKPGGIFRVSVPDLEENCRKYLYYLEKTIEDPSAQNLLRYKWSVMEIFEQMVRDKSGGLMLEAIRSGQYDPEYMDHWYSDVFRPFFQIGERDKSPPRIQSGFKTLRVQLRILNPQQWFMALIQRTRNVLIRTFLDEDRVLDNRHPLVTKEASRWMYDRLSLHLLIQKAGFVDFQHKTFKDSDIPNWAKYDLDRSNYANRPIDPSVYIESKKPQVRP